jgi:hypothetical protein
MMGADDMDEEVLAIVRRALGAGLPGDGEGATLT